MNLDLPYERSLHAGNKTGEILERGVTLAPPPKLGHRNDFFLEWMVGSADCMNSAFRRLRITNTLA